MGEHARLGKLHQRNDVPSSRASEIDNPVRMERRNLGSTDGVPLETDPLDDSSREVARRILEDAAKAGLIRRLGPLSISQIGVHCRLRNSALSGTHPIPSGVAISAASTTLIHSPILVPAFIARAPPIVPGMPARNSAPTNPLPFISWTTRVIGVPAPKVMTAPVAVGST